MECNYNIHFYAHYIMSNSIHCIYIKHDGEPKQVSFQVSYRETNT